MLLSAPLLTLRLSVRSLTVSDVTPRYVSWLNDPEINRYLESRFVRQTNESVRSFVETLNASPTDLLCGLFLREGARHIGNVRLGPIDIHHRRAPIGILMGEKDVWGKGLGAEAVTAFVDYAFDALSLRKVTAACYEANLASAQMFRKAGFHHEARFPKDLLCEGAWQDRIAMARVSAETL